MSKLLDWLVSASEASGLAIEVAFQLNRTTGISLNSVARVAGVGATNGMLIFRSYDDLEPHAEELIHAGFGYAVLDEPGQTEVFQLESYQAMFSDWGWTGNPSLMPSWMR